MMSNVPKLRFKEFSGEWISKAINEISHVNPKSKDLPDEFIYIDLESVEKGMLIKESRISKNSAPSRAQRLLKNDDILFQTVRPYQKNNYYFSLGDNYVASTGYAQLRTKESSRFLYQKLHTEKFVNAVMLRCTGTSYPAINSTDLGAIKISIPSKPEQEKIASFLTSVDTKIELLVRKEELLQQYKKGVMQKIFSQEIRFKADDGSEFPEWEEKKLGEVGKIYQPKTISQTDLTEEGFDVYGANGIIGKYSEYNHEFEQIAITCRGNTCGTVNYTKPKSWITGNAMVVNLDNSKVVNKMFMYYQLSHSNLTYLITGSGQPQITGDIKTHQVLVPCLKEQTKIDNFLSSIDSKIAQVSAQLDSTKAFKKALLQQMFV